MGRPIAPKAKAIQAGLDDRKIDQEVIKEDEDNALDELFFESWDDFLIEEHAKDEELL